jgi:hypothetical protein
VAIESHSKISIISKALILLGEQPLNSLSDDRYGATVGANLFEIHFENELQGNPWRFASKKKALSRLNLEPLNQYRYVFQLPSDCLIVSHVYPRTDYEIFGAHLYANQSSVDLDYRFKPEVSALPSYFALYLAYALAKDMVNPITEGAATKVQVFTGKYNQQRSVALYADAQARPSKPIQDNPFVQVRG